MKMLRVRAIFLVLVLVLLPGCGGSPGKQADTDFNGFLSTADKADSNKKGDSEMKKLIFIHHSCGQNLLEDDHGGWGKALMENGYFVSDTNYGWGPDGIGNNTDIGHWWNWFRGPDSPEYTAALFTEYGQNSYYTRPEETPEGENEIIVFKSCFPNSMLKGDPAEAVPAIADNPLRGENCGSEYFTVANAKGIYIDLLKYFETRKDKLFIAVTAPPVIDGTYGDNARKFNEWLVKDWLKDYKHKNVRVLDFFGVLTCNSEGVCFNTLQYPSSPEDSHPSPEGNRKAVKEFIPLVNKYYSEWKK